MSSHASWADISQELEDKTLELESLKKTYEEFMESSMALEKELEDSLAAADENCANLMKKKQVAEEKLTASQDKCSQLSKEISKLETELANAKEQLSRLEAAKRTLEISNDQLEDRVRILEATEEDLQHKLQLAEENVIMFRSDIDDLKAEHSETEKRLKSELTELQIELATLESSIPASLQEQDTKAVDAQSQRITEVDQAFAEEAGILLSDAIEEEEGEGVEGEEAGAATADTSAQDELIEALELEIEDLTSRLNQSEQQNQQLNEELSRLADELISAHEERAKVVATCESPRDAVSVVDSQSNALTTNDDSVVSSHPAEDAAALLLPSVTEEVSKEDSEAAARAEELAAKLTESQQLVSDLQAQLSEVSVQLSAAREDLLEQELKSKAREEVLQLLQQTVTDLTEKLDAKTTELHTVTAVALEVKTSYEQTIQQLREEGKELSDRLAEFSLEKMNLLNDLNTSEHQTREANAALAAVKEDLSKEWATEKAELLHTIETWRKRAATRALSPTPSTPSSAPSSASKGVIRSSPVRKIAFRPTSPIGSEDVVGDLIAKSMSSNSEAQELIQYVEKAETGEQVVSPARLLSPPRSARSPARHPPSSSRVEKIVIDSSTTQSVSAAAAIASGDIERMRQEIRSQTVILEALRMSNAKLLQKLQSARGNIVVACRTRPPSKQELAQRNGNKICVDVIDDNELACFDKKSDVWRPFVFDRIWSMDASQSDVFADVEPLVMSVIDGYNTCLFAYGQTGSGKTYTMNGYGDQYGVSYRTLHRMFELLMLKEMQAMNQTNVIRSKSHRHSTVITDSDEAAAKPEDEGAEPAAAVAEGQEGGNSGGEEGAAADSKSDDEDENNADAPPFKYEVKVSMMEIYNDQVIDLLVAPGSGRPLDIRQAADGSICVPDLSQVSVRCFDEVMTVFARGSACRATATTNVNEHSSRSHLILQVDVLTVARGELPVHAKLYLVDLAGSERLSKSGAVGSAMKEAQYINKSLSALGDVMEALDQKSKHIPYRNSKLTYLLQDALGGNSRTMMIITLCPTELTSDETLFTLQFATRVRNVTLGPARKNVNAKNLEDALKSLKGILRDSKKKRSQLEDSVSELKKELKRNSDKMTTQIDTKARLVDDAKREALVQLQTLTKSNADLSSRLYEEKESKTVLQLDIDNLQKALKKANDQVKEMTKDREGILLASRQKDKEIAHLKLKCIGHASAPAGPSITEPGAVTSAGKEFKTGGASVLSPSQASPEHGFNRNDFHPTNLAIAIDAAQLFVVTSDGDEVPTAALQNKDPSMPPPSAAGQKTDNPRTSRLLRYSGVKSSPVNDKSTRTPQTAERSMAAPSTFGTPGAVALASASADSQVAAVSGSASKTSSARKTSHLASKLRLDTGLVRPINKTPTRNVTSTAAGASAAASGPTEAGRSSRKPSLIVSAAIDEVDSKDKAKDATAASTATRGTSIAASRLSIAQRSKEALLKHQERMRNKSLVDAVAAPAK